MRKFLDRAHGGLNAGPQRRVYILVDVQGVAALYKALNRAHTGEIAGRVYMAVFLTQKRGKFLFQPPVIAAAAVGNARARAAAAPFAQRPLTGFNHFGVVVESQVVVATEKDHFLAVFPDVCAHLLVKVVVVRLIFEALLGDLVFEATLNNTVFLFFIK